MPKPKSKAEIEAAVARAGRTRVDGRTLPGAADLSRDAIAQRRIAKAQSGQDGGLTGHQLILAAVEVFDQAKRLARVAQRRGAFGRASRASDRSDDALRTAAVQIRLAAVTPLDRGYLHALDLQTIQTIKSEVSRAYDVDEAALAVDTHRRIEDQRARARAETAGGR